MDARILIAAASMPSVLHISCDYPDAVQPAKTRAISNLVDYSRDRFDHRVYSLNRRGIGIGALGELGRVERVADDGRVASWRYAAPAGGLFLRTALLRVADAIAQDVARRGDRPALVQGHKLSVEGIVAQRVAHLLDIPYALSLQGNTDQRITDIRRDLHARYRDIFLGAAQIFPFTPWIFDHCTRRFGTPSRPPVYLPCITAQDALIPPVDVTEPRLVTAFHLEHHRLKNLDGLVAGARHAAAAVPGLGLDIAGTGTPAVVAEVDRIIAGAAPARVQRVGPVAHDGIQRWMNVATGMALVSRRESFGMVFVEALMAGTPIIYPRDAAVDGYFDGQPFAIPAAARDPAEIGEAMVRIVREASAMKAALYEWQQSGGADRFRRDAIVAAYIAGLNAAIAAE